MLQREKLLDIMDRRALHPLFQPIMDLHHGNVIGYEGLIRGPVGTDLHMPQALFQAAEHTDLLVRLEMLCVYTVMTQFVQAGLPGRLFVNISPFALLAGALSDPLLNDLVGEHSALKDRVVFEITEGSPQMDSASVVAGLMTLRERGFKIALDDLGEGFSSLRLWSDVRPDFVKLDKHFVTGIDKDPVKLQFVRSIKQIAEKSNAIIIAEGIEHRAELLILKEMGICLGQGYFIGHPVVQPKHVASAAAQACFDSALISANPWSKMVLQRGRQVRLLLTEVPTVTVQTTSEDALKILLANPELNVLPVLDGKLPVGLLNRTMVDKFSHGYIRDLYSRKSCTVFMEKAPLIVDVEMSVVALSQLVLMQGQKRFADGFILVRDGAYAGIGSNFALMQEMTRLQIQEARYANPLTMLPGNVPINEQMELLMGNGQQFCACYVDLDYFKPFNDVFGYRRGDELIKLTAEVLVGHADKDIDFVGHIGGDDFFLLFQSHDWEQRCESVLLAFDTAIKTYLQHEDLGDGCYVAEDRRGNRAEYSFPSLSIGAVPVGRNQFHECHEIAAAATEVKKAAKKISGSCLYVDRRAVLPGQTKVLAAA
ncbi:MAG: GGDEF domain-containing protein [Sulfuriferula sp.]|nr:GGDEF domain-containing protein [Sulfuriferula sp.]